MTGRRPLAAMFFVLLVGAAGCGRGDRRGPTIEFTRAAMGALPSVALGAPVAAAALSARASGATGTIADHPWLANLFKMECQHLPDTNYCPPTVHPTTDLMDPTRFEMGSLIGMVFHAQLYTGTLVTSCSGSGLSPASVSAGSYFSQASTGSDPTRFVLDQFSLYTCRDGGVDSSSAETRVVSADGAGAYQAALHTRHRYEAGGQVQTDLFQVYAGMNAGAPTFLAFNFPAAAPHAERAVLLANLVNHRFALKYYVPAQGGASAFFAVAAGVGGYDLATGAAHPGHYQVAFSGGSGTPLCVDNVGGIVEPDGTACAEDGVPIGWTTTDAIRSYLGASDGDAARAAPFLAMFQDDAPLGPADAWQAPGDEDLYWPAGIR